MKIVCDKCEDVIDSDEMVEVEVYFASTSKTGDYNSKWHVCRGCGRKTQDKIKEFIGGAHADSKKR